MYVAWLRLGLASLELDRVGRDERVLAWTVTSLLCPSPGYSKRLLPLLHSSDYHYGLGYCILHLALADVSTIIRHTLRPTRLVGCRCASYDLLSQASRSIPLLSIHVFCCEYDFFCRDLTQDPISHTGPTAHTSSCLASPQTNTPPRLQQHEARLQRHVEPYFL